MGSGVDGPIRPVSVSSESDASSSVSIASWQGHEVSDLSLTDSTDRISKGQQVATGALKSSSRSLAQAPTPLDKRDIKVSSSPNLESAIRRFAILNFFWSILSFFVSAAVPTCLQVRERLNELKDEKDLRDFRTLAQGRPTAEALKPLRPGAVRAMLKEFERQPEIVDFRGQTRRYIPLSMRASGGGEAHFGLPELLEFRLRAVESPYVDTSKLLAMPESLQADLGRSAVFMGERAIHENKLASSVVLFSNEASGVSNKENGLKYFQVLAAELKSKGVLGTEALFIVDAEGKQALNYDHPLVNIIPRVLHQGCIAPLQEFQSGILGEVVPSLGGKSERVSFFNRVEVSLEDGFLFQGRVVAETCSGGHILLQKGELLELPETEITTMRMEREATQSIRLPVDLTSMRYEDYVSERPEFFSRVISAESKSSPIGDRLTRIEHSLSKEEREMVLGTEGKVWADLAFESSYVSPGFMTDSRFDSVWKYGVSIAEDRDQVFAINTEKAGAGRDMRRSQVVIDGRPIDKAKFTREGPEGALARYFEELMPSLEKAGAIGLNTLLVPQSDGTRKLNLEHPLVDFISKAFQQRMVAPAEKLEKMAIGSPMPSPTERAVEQSVMSTAVSSTGGRLAISFSWDNRQESLTPSFYSMSGEISFSEERRMIATKTAHQEITLPLDLTPPESSSTRYQGYDIGRCELSGTFKLLAASLRS